jgi:hypothetical protein
VPASKTYIPLKLEFDFDGDRPVIKGLPAHLEVRSINYPSQAISELKHLAVASANIMAAKFYMDSTLQATKKTDPHMYDAALLAAIVKYASVFKPDKNGRAIDATQVFTTQIRIFSSTLGDELVVIPDPDLEFLAHHNRLIILRDKMIAHDDRMFGNCECFAAFDGNFRCEHVVALTQKNSVFSAIKLEYEKLPMCIDIVLTWLASEKENYCQIVNDEINQLKLKKRRRFPAPIFNRFMGLSDAEARKARRDAYWELDWSTGQKRLVTVTNGLNRSLRATLLSSLRRLRSFWPIS